MRAAYVPVRRSRVARAPSAIQLIQDAVRFNGVRRAAAGAQGFQVLLQGAQLTDALADMLDVFVEQGVDLAAVL